jgi:hypothetical protein
VVKKAGKHDRVNRLMEQVLAGVRSICSKYSVTDVHGHFAGYWDELGMTITFDDATADEAVISARNEMVVWLEWKFSELKPPFTWMLSIRRQLSTIDVVFPGDAPRSVDEVLEPMP